MNNKTITGNIAFICLLAFGALVIIACAFAPKNAKPEQTETVTGIWHEGKLPVGYPVIGLWSVDGEIICEPCIQTDFAGIYEYSPVANPSRQLTPPDYWIDMPRRNP
jgi:hypothetical protein